MKDFLFPSAPGGLGAGSPQEIKKTFQAELEQELKQIGRKYI